MRGQVQPKHVNSARRRGDQTEEHLDRRRLPGAVGTEQTKNLARSHLKGDAIDRGEIAEAFEEVAYLQKRLGHRSNDNR